MTTPTITNVSGTISTGQTLTITGTNMVDHDTTNWDTGHTEDRASFEGASLIADGWVATSGAQATDRELLGTKSFKNTFSGAVTFPAQHVGRLYNQDWTLSAPFWIRFYVRADSTTTGDGSWPDTYHKLAAWYGPGGVGSIFLNWQATGSTPTRFLVIQGGTDTSSAVTIQEKKWHCVEIRYPSAGSTSCEVFFDDVSILSTTLSGHANDASFVEFDENSGDTGAGYGMEMWFDGVVASSSRVNPASFVEISNNSSYGAGTLVYQLPEGIANTSNVVTCNLTGLGAGPYYMFVTNNRGETSAAFNLSGGGGGGSTGRTKSKRVIGLTWTR